LEFLAPDREHRSNGFLWLRSWWHREKRGNVPLSLANEPDPASSAVSHSPQTVRMTITETHRDPERLAVEDELVGHHRNFANVTFGTIAPENRKAIVSQFNDRAPVPHIAGYRRERGRQQTFNIKNHKYSPTKKYI
jgi:hypothetical protein